MEKKVIIEGASLLLVILAVLGIWYFARMPASEPASQATIPTFDASLAAKGCIDEGKAVVDLLAAVDAKDAARCPSLSPHNAFCKAALGVDECAGLALMQEQASCAAILAKKPASCEKDELCHILAGDTSCSTGTDHDFCMAAVARDSNKLTDPAACEQIAQNMQQRITCTSQAQNDAEAAAC
ncbi:MAG TPA: hypothetical protein VLJ21_05270 [Candidatus Binatia bacterium]|nr:hypothetical protein [Candidatus Binatia bacterium]